VGHQRASRQFQNAFCGSRHTRPPWIRPAKHHAELKPYRRELAARLLDNKTIGAATDLMHIILKVRRQPKGGAQ
jgi:hypothetical protein